MLIARTRKCLQDAVTIWKQSGARIGFVPTMGALHEGHISLMNLAKTRSDKTIASIFVNPTQFAPHEDFDRYPRLEEADCLKLEDAGVDMVYLPSAAEIYEDGMAPRITPGKAAEGLESDFRPHFFGGVVNVAERLFAHVRPDIAIFGEKDYQQLEVIREMAAAYDIPIEILGGPIIRDEHGLALSSRNAYLSPEELAIARQMNKILLRISSLRGAAGDAAIQNAPQALLEAGFTKIDYIAPRWGRLLAAAWLGKTRLIDNVEVHEKHP